MQSPSSKTVTPPRVHVFTCAIVPLPAPKVNTRPPLRTTLPLERHDTKQDYSTSPKGSMYHLQLTSLWHALRRYINVCTPTGKVTNIRTVSTRIGRSHAHHFLLARAYATATAAPTTITATVVIIFSEPHRLNLHFPPKPSDALPSSPRIMSTRSTGTDERVNARVLVVFFPSVLAPLDPFPWSCFLLRLARPLLLSLSTRSSMSPSPLPPAQVSPLRLCWLASLATIFTASCPHAPSMSRP